MKTARAWRTFYAEERAGLGERGLTALLERAPRVGIPDHGALVFPHVKLEDAGAMVAAVASAVVDSGCDEVLAIGVLHGAREEDADLVAHARRGDVAALGTLRRVHDETSPFVAEEFSLDGFRALVGAASLRAGRAVPTVHARYPFLVGDDPASLPGLDDLEALLRRGCLLVATTDPIHHGAGYGTPDDERLPRRSAGALAFAKSAILRQLDALCERRFADFQTCCADVRSDFRDTGPVLALLAPNARAEIVDLVLSDYATVLDAPPPTWVAAALVALDRA